MSEPNWSDLFRLLSGMARLFQSCSTEEELFDVADWYIPRMFEGVDGAIHLFADADAKARSFTWGESESIATPPDMESNATLVKGQPLLIAPDAPAQGGCAAGTLTVPIIAAKRPLGVLQLAATEAEALENAQGMAFITAEHMALTVDNIRIRTRLKNLAVKDALTGLFNRRFFDESMNRETREAQETGAPLSVVMFDIDHFKNLNDTKGHDAGDVALQSVGRFLGATAGENDIPCRYGGEEFFFIMKGSNYEQALEMGETIRAGIAALNITHGEIQVSPINVSVGVALYPDHGDTPDKLAKAADLCLYHAKEHGRNQVVGYETIKK
ncbi:sensor domain-containing diguanylate cyclase [Desulfovibrio ferrophilus]|uniref:diguanylate cyclase n=1 Tax=Desulfovibrio ferrophilus TaxID=241368 RepID=A0A2Z6AU41_9BACT|nr:sensor domain-containing diguanylate cyclase [Desulfovibrio ferrophilus]BBD06739.1 response regulator PleD [Desulfovibrio ferrophilus]